MLCEDAAPLIHAGESSPDLEVHLSACDDCRMLSEDLAELGAASNGSMKLVEVKETQ